MSDRSRKLVVDTETTGMATEQGHRIIEIGCIPLRNRRIHDDHLHLYLNPNREIDEGAFRVHGLSREFLKDKPPFEECVEKFLSYIKGAELIIHNAPFDMGFFDAELMRVGKGKLLDYCTVTDTLPLARKKHPGVSNSLDALCKRYQVDLSQRQLHGALLDAQLLAHVYLAMTAGQDSLFEEEAGANSGSESHRSSVELPDFTQSGVKSFIRSLLEAEHQAHQTYLQFLREKAGGQCLWDDVLE